MRKSNLKLWKQDVDAMEVMNKKIDELYSMIDAKNRIIEQQLLEMAQLKKQHNKVIEYINNASYFDGSSMCANDLLEILGGKE